MAWIKITDEIPQECVRVWGCSADGKQGLCHNDGHNIKFDNEIHAYSIITHWMPYPRQPDPPHSERMFIAQNISVAELVLADKLKRKSELIKQKTEAIMQTEVGNG